MPVILRHHGYRFFFWANEGNPREPLHIHVRKGGAVAKFWVEPEVRVAESYDIYHKNFENCQKLYKENKELIERKWHEFFGE